MDNSKKILLLIFIILIGIIYFHPTKETMTCHSDYTCTVEHEFVNITKLKHKIRISPRSIISTKAYDYPQRRRRSRGYYVYVLIDGNNPFVMYQIESHNNLDIDDGYYVSFKNYIQNPNNGFTISSYANSQNCYMWLLFLLVFILVGLYEKFVENR